MSSLQTQVSAQHSSARKSYRAALESDSQRQLCGRSLPLHTGQALLREFHEPSQQPKPPRACPAVAVQPGLNSCEHQQHQQRRPHWQRLAAVLALVALLVVMHRPAAALAASSAPAQSGGLLHKALHLDNYLKVFIDQHGSATYGLLWAIVFAETGFVLTPFLPGDSLLFAAGAFCASGALRLATVCGVFLSAAILGDALNYFIGSRVGERALSSRLIKQTFIRKTKNFYAKYGGKTIVLARFVPIIRTFAPFVAGVGRMDYKRFAAFNVVGAFIWVLLFTGAGYLVGGSPMVKDNFALVVLAIVAVSVLPVIFEIWNSRRAAQQSSPEALVAGTASEPNFSWITPSAGKSLRDPNLEWLL